MSGSPLFFTSTHAQTIGASSVVQATATGFRVSLRVSGKNKNKKLKAQQVKAWQWQVTWLVPTTPVTDTNTTPNQVACSGQTPQGSSGWVADGKGGVYVEVDTRSCNLTGTPHYYTTLGGADQHWLTTGGTAMTRVTATGFRVTVKMASGTAVTPAQAEGWRWHLNWLAFAGETSEPEVVNTKYYYFNGQRIAMRKDGVLTYLHSDHLGSTILATDAAGASVGNQGYFAYGKQRSGDGVPTDYQFTGQMQDGSGLQYFNARHSPTTNRDSKTSA